MLSLRRICHMLQCFLCTLRGPRGLTSSHREEGILKWSIKLALVWFFIPVLSRRWFVFSICLGWTLQGGNWEDDGAQWDKGYRQFFISQEEFHCAKCVQLVNFSQQFQREKSRMTELVMKCKESGRVSHTSGGTDVQTRGLVSWRRTGVLWLGSLDLQQGGLPRVTAWDVALCTALTEVSSEPCSSSTCQSLNPTSDSRSMCVHLVAFSPTEGLGWGFQGWEHWLCKLPWVSFRCPHCQ